MSNQFNWDDLRHFLGVARAGTVSLAARRLGVDHATITRRIDALEHALRAKLFERNPRGYNLTQRGERLLLAAEAIEDETERASREIGGDAQRMSGLVRISSVGGLGSYFLASRLAHFASQHPKLMIEFITIQQIVALSRREADIAITLQPPEAGQFLNEKLTDYDLFVYGAPDYLAKHPPIETTEDLVSHPFCGFIDDLIFVRGLDYLGDVSPGIRSNLKSSSLFVQMTATREGFGLCVLPYFVAQHMPDLVRVLPEKVSLRRSFWLVARAEVASSSRVQILRRYIREEVEKAQDLFMPDNAATPVVVPG